MVVLSLPYKARLIWEQGQIRVDGPQVLEDRIRQWVKNEGSDPKNWKLRSVQDGWDIMLNQWLLQIQGLKNTCYPHEELCHCRMISLEIVENAIKQGVFKQSDISRVTLAGTGCGSCKKDIDDLLQFHIK